MPSKGDDVSQDRDRHERLRRDEKLRLVGGEPAEAEQRAYEGQFREADRASCRGD